MDNEYHTMKDVDWRWSSQPIRVIGLDPLILLVIPLLLGTGFSMLASIVSAIFVALLVYIAVRTKHGSFITWLSEMRTRFIQRNKWEVQ